MRGEEANDDEGAADELEQAGEADHGKGVERAHVHAHGRGREANDLGETMLDEEQAGHDAKDAEHAGSPGGDHKFSLVGRVNDAMEKSGDQMFSWVTPEREK